MVLTNQKIVAHNAAKEPIYFVTFEDYLKPEIVLKKHKPLLLHNKNCKNPPLRLRLLEHPVLVAGRKSKLRVLKEKIQKKRKTLQHLKLKEKLPKKWKFVKFPGIKRKIKQPPNANNKYSESVVTAATRWHNRTFKKPTATKEPVSFLSNMQLPTFLRFLRARNDDGMCKRKSGFEIYCEMASIHGFVNFVGSTTPQRAFWFIVLFIAISISVGILIMSHLMSTTTPTIIYLESTQYPSWSIPFPAVTICNINRISKTKAKVLADKLQKPSNVSAHQILNLFRLALYATENVSGTSEEYRLLMDILEANNINQKQLLKTLMPDCEAAIKRCKWKGRNERCNKLFKKIQTEQGTCCSFNDFSSKVEGQKRSDSLLNDNIEYITSCGPDTGLSVLIDPDLQDYHLAARKTGGFQIFLHDIYDYTHAATTHHLVLPRSINRLGVVPRQTHSTDYIETLKLPTRRCYLQQERKLFYFPTYSQANCLTECRSQMLYDKCRCSLAHWPKKANWTVCGLRERECFEDAKELLKRNLKSITGDYRYNHYAEKYICDCYPLCDFNQYSLNTDAGKLDRTYALSDKRFFKDINITQHILLHIYYEDLYAERLRYDVFENWLSFIGTFGGITGLQMGYSAVSGFELIFFVLVRPACNWLTKKQIRFRIKRKQRKAQIEAEKRRKAEEERLKQEKIEAYLKMRPYCPG